MKIVAEIGSNWSSKQDCLDSIAKAKLAGADAVKFQLFTPRSLQGPNATESISQIGTSPYLNHLWIHDLAEEAKKNDIEFMCTAFSPREYQLIDPYVKEHKIASAELTDINILETVNSFRKPVYLSTAGSDIQEEIRNALLLLRDCPVTIMYCVADYPARIIDFRFLEELQNTFGKGYKYGYSDHSTDVLVIPVRSRKFGAEVIEKHVNLINLPSGPDVPHSINFQEFSLMCQTLKGEIPSVQQIQAISNKQMNKFWKRKFMVTQPIPYQGKFVFNENFGCFRPYRQTTDPVNTFRLFDLNGKTASRALSPGEVITYTDIE